MSTRSWFDPFEKDDDPSPWEGRLHDHVDPDDWSRSWQTGFGLFAPNEAGED